MPRENKRKKPSLTVQITISLIIGIVAGIAMQSIPDIAEGYVKPFGTIYLNLIKMIVVPVVVLSIIQGIVSLQDVRKVGAIGIKTIAFYLVTTAIAVTLGLVAANLLQVGAGYTLGISLCFPGLLRGIACACRISCTACKTGRGHGQNQ